MNYRNKKILNHARNMECQNCGADDGTVVMAHSNHQRHGKGVSIKAHDIFVAALCMRCHTFVDAGKASREERDLVWSHAHDKTMLRLVTDGVLR